MTAAPDDDTLGLNLVYTDPSSLSSPNLSLGGGVVKKPKRKTKYDRRRERGKLAKLAKDDEKRKKRDNGSGGTATLQHQEDKSSRDVGDNSKTDVGGGSSSLAGIASLLGGSSVKEQKKRKIASQSMPFDTTTYANVESTSIKDKKEETIVEDSDAKSKAKVIANEEDTKSAADSIVKEESKEEAAPTTSMQSTPLPSVENTKPSVSLATEDTASSSRRHRVSSKSLSTLMHFL